MSRELRSCAVVGVEARRRATEPARVHAHQEGRREGLAQGFSRRRTLLGRLAALRFGGEVADRVAGLLAGIADQQRLDAAALAQLDLVGGSSPKGSICRRPSGARTPPSASPSTPHLGAERGRGRPRTKSSARYSELISSAEIDAELTSRLGANRRKGGASASARLYLIRGGSLPTPLGPPCQSMGCSAGWPPRATQRLRSFVWQCARGVGRVAASSRTRCIRTPTTRTATSCEGLGTRPRRRCCS